MEKHSLPPQYHLGLVRKLIRPYNQLVEAVSGKAKRSSTGDIESIRRIKTVKKQRVLVTVFGYKPILFLSGGSMYPLYAHQPSGY